MATLDRSETAVDELLHVVGEQRLVNAKQRDQLALANLLVAAAQHIQDPHTHRLAERLRRSRDPFSAKREVKARGRSAAPRSGRTWRKNRKRRGHINNH